MKDEQSLIENVEQAINSSQDLVQIVENLAEVDVLDSSDFATNSQILADYMKEFQFDWDNEAFDNEEDFVSETVSKIKQILADIKSGNKYKRIFSAELAYSYLYKEDYSYKTFIENMTAKTIDEAVKEKDKIRAKAPKQHPEDKNFALEDVRVRVKIVDQNQNTVLEEKFLLN